MDIITTAIVMALGELGNSVIKDAYYALKTAIASKCGINSDVLNSIDNLEEKPNSLGRRETLKEEVVVAHILEDQELIEQAQNLLQKLDKFTNQTGVSINIEQKAGDNSIQIGQVNSGDVNIKHNQ